MDKKVFEGKDLEEAKHKAADSLGIPEPDLDYEIIEQGRRGLFGIGAKSVQIRVMPPISPLEPQANELLGVAPAGARQGRGRNRKRGRRSGGRERASGESVIAEQAAGERPPMRSKPKQEPRPKRSRSRRRREKPEGPPREPVTEADVEKVQTTLQQMIDLMGLELKADAEGDGSTVQIAINGPDDAMLDRDTELMSSLQFVLNRMARRTWPDVGRIRLGEQPRSSGRDSEVIELVREVAQQVTETGEPKQLHPMNAYERRLVHLTIRKTGGLGSRSEGDGSLKKVSIFKQDKKPGGRRRSRSRRGGRGRKRADG